MTYYIIFIAEEDYHNVLINLQNSQIYQWIIYCGYSSAQYAVD